MRYFALAVGFAFVFATAAARAEEPQKNDLGKCWTNTDKANYHWGDCPKEAHKEKGGHAKKG